MVGSGGHGSLVAVRQPRFGGSSSSAAVVRRQQFGYSLPRRLGAAAVRLLEATAAGCGGSGSAATARSTKPKRETRISHKGLQVSLNY